MPKSILNITLIALLSAILLSIAGCARNIPVTPDGSQPNEYSAYLYSAGDVLYLNRDFAGAESVFRMALRYDPKSSEIKKALFNTLLYRAENNEIPLAQLESFVDTLLVQKEMDKIMLEQAYNTFAKAKDNLKAKHILEIYLKKYATARAYTSLFYLEQELYGKSRPELLDKAYKLAGNDPEFLNSLGYLYQVYDSTKAEAVWLNARKYDSTTASAQFLWELYARNNDSAKLHKLWNSFRLPEDKEKLMQILSSSFENADFHSIILLGDAILASGDPQIILFLLQSSWYTNENTLFEQSWNKLQSMKLTNLESQLSNFYAALYYLRSNRYSAALVQLAKLDGKSSLDELISIFRATALTGTVETDSTRIAEVRDKLYRTIEPATEAQLAAPVKRYLLAATDSLGYSNEISLPDSISQYCVEWFYKNNRRTYDTYFWLALFFNRTKQDERSKAILREALDEYPEDAALLNWLGYSYVLSGDNLEEAEVLIRRALQLAPDNPYYLDSLAWLFYSKGDFQQALTLMEIPSQLEQMPSEIAFHLGSIYYAVNDKEKAIQYLKLAIEINDEPDSVVKAKNMLSTLQ